VLTARISKLAGLPATLAAVLAVAALAAPAAFAAGAGSTQLISRPDGAGPVRRALDNDSSTPGALSADGRYAVFVSDADGLAPGVNPRVRNVFVRDRQTQTTHARESLRRPRRSGRRLRGRQSGCRGAGVRWARARRVRVGCHEHDRPRDRSGRNPDHLTEVWLRDVTAGRTTLVRRASGANGAPADQSAQNPAIADSNGGPRQFRDPLTRPSVRITHSIEQTRRARDPIDHPKRGRRRRRGPEQRGLI
jgi:hypothetical protein